MAVKHICILVQKIKERMRRVAFLGWLAFFFLQNTTKATNQKTKFYKLTFASSQIPLNPHHYQNNKSVSKK
jgi:hypothetical protein